MEKNLKRRQNNYCSECGSDITDINHIRPFAKVCKECREISWSANAEVKKITTELRKRNSMMTREELGMDEKFVDDPRALKEIEYGRVSRQPTLVNNYASPIGSNYDV